MREADQLRPRIPRQVYDQIDRELVTGPPLTLHLPVPSLFVEAAKPIRGGKMDAIERDDLRAPDLEPGHSLRFCPPSPQVPALATLESAPTVAAGWNALAAAR